MGKKSGGSAPAAPDPKETAAAQAASNISTAQVNAAMGTINQITPDGSLTYSQSGSSFIADNNGQTYWRGPNGEYQSAAPTTTTAGGRRWVSTNGGSVMGREGADDNYAGLTSGAPGTGSGYWVDEPGQQTPAAGWSQVKGYYVPTYTATTKLSPQQQAIKDQVDAARLNLGTIANDRSAFLKDYLAKPFTLDNEATESRLMELGRKRLDPMLADRRSSLETSLANQGIRLGSAAYDNAMRQAGQDENDARTSLILSGRQQAVQELLTERAQPLNEIGALLSGSQVSQPQWAPVNAPSVPNVDYAGLVQANYAAKMQEWQQKQANRQSILGGLFGLGSAAIMASDRRLKTDVTRVGTGPLGLGIYAFRYVWGGPRRLGLMAQEVAKVLPSAVMRLAGGFLAVDYAQVQESA